MKNCGSLLKRALVAIVLVAMLPSGSTVGQMKGLCCTTVDRREINETITGYFVRRDEPPCVQAVVFQTKTGFYCSQLNAPWVLPKIVAFEKTKTMANLSSVEPSSTSSLLSNITSPPSSSSSLALSSTSLLLLTSFLHLHI